MADLKTVPTRFSVDKFLKGITDEQKRADCFEIMKIMERATKSRAKMWGPAIVGYITWGPALNRRPSADERRAPLPPGLVPSRVGSDTSSDNAACL